MRIRCRWTCIVAILATHGCLTNLAAAGDDPEEKPKELEKAEEEKAEPEALGVRPPRPDLGILGPKLETEVATKTPVDILLSPSTISVLRQPEIRESGARYPSGVLRLVPGMEVQRVYSMLSNVSVRGFNDSPTTAQGVLALIDGRQVYNEFLGNALWDQLMLIPEDLEEIEVIRGPGSFLYGPNAMHGVVNFKTRSPLDYSDSEVAVLGSVGSFDSVIGRFRYVKRDQESGSGLIANVVYDDVDKYEPSGANTRDKVYGTVRFEKDLGGGSRAGARKSDHLLEVGAGISDQKFDLLLASLDVLPGLPPVPPDMYSAQMQEKYLTGKYTREGLVAQATWTGFDSSLEPGVFYAPFNLDLDVLDLDIHYSFNLLKDHELTVGAGYRYATFDTEDLDVSFGRQNTNLISAYIQDEATLVQDKLFFTGGVRVDHHSEAGSNLSPRAALVWKLQESQSLRVSYGRGYRNPSLLENFLALPLTLPGLGTATVTGSTEVEAEQMDSFELGYRGWFDDAKLRVGATGYLNYIDNLMSFQLVAPGVVSPINQDEYRAYGLELEAEYEISESFTAFGNYSYGVLEDRAAGERVRAGPLNKANLGVRYSTHLSGSSSLNAMLWVTYFDETEQTFPGGFVDDYFLLNGSVSVEFAPGRSAFIKFFNVLDDRHRENPEGNELGRTLELGVRFRW